MTDPITLEKCETGAVYRLRSRNLEVGVYDGKGGFIGVREKFYSRYLFTEYHYDQGPPHGTAHAIEKLGEIDPEIELKESFLTCLTCNERVESDHTREHDVRYMGNRELFRQLDRYESIIAEEKYAKGELWLGREQHRFQLMDEETFNQAIYGKNETPIAYVSVEEYLKAQREAGVAIGLHHFVGDNGVCGQVTLDYSNLD